MKSPIDTQDEAAGLRHVILAICPFFSFVRGLGDPVESIPLLERFPSDNLGLAYMLRSCLSHERLLFVSVFSPLVPQEKFYYGIVY